jgi:hypothetical protein
VISRRKVGIGALLLAACKPEARPTSPQSAQPRPSGSAAPSASAAPPAAEPKLVDLGAVAHGAPARRVLYSWTTAEQAAEIERGGKLFLRSENPDYGPGYLVRWLRSQNAAPLRDLLLDPRFERGRFGWPAAWATVMGWRGADYGLSLIRVALRPEALIVRLHSSKPGLAEVYDMQNARVQADVLLRRPERLGAIYFVNDQTVRLGGRGVCDSSYVGADVYREYFFGNDAMLETWSMRDEDCLAEIDRGRAAVLRVAGELGPDKTPPKEESWCAWAHRVASERWTRAPATPLETYEAAVATPNDQYKPTAAALDAIARRLEKARFAPQPVRRRG